MLLILFVSAAGLAALEDGYFTVQVQSRGEGWVTLSPPGNYYKAGTKVTLTATPSYRSTFNSWGGDLEGYQATQTITVEENLKIKARFKRGYRKGLVQNTNYGKVKGQRKVYTDPVNSNISYDSLSWLGIPFAAPPVGELRWKAPQEPASWRGVKEMLNLPPYSAQIDMFTNKPIGQEDCLYLNVYRPNTDDYDLPVYVWIHGGGNMMGYSALYDVNMNNLAQKLNAVVVVIQYRLGDMGVFYHDRLEGTIEERSGNFNILDQIKALQWVGDNIEYFGGRADNVTIAGESAGASNILGLMVSPYAKGLFHRAIYQSGGMDFLTKDEPRARANRMVEALIKARAAAGKPFDETDDALEMLRSADIMELMTLRDPNDYYGLIVDGHVIPDDPYKMVTEGRYNRVPVILGACKDEATIFNVFYAYSAPIFNRIFGTNIPNYMSLETMLKRGVDIYKGSNSPGSELAPMSPATVDAFIKSSRVMSDLWTDKHVHQLARALKLHQNDVYLYQYSWDGEEGSQTQMMLGATHGAEIPFFHGGSKIDAWGYGNIYTESTRVGREELEGLITRFTANFMQSGNPNGNALPLWKPLTKEGKLNLFILDSRDSVNTADPAYTMVEREFNRAALLAEGYGFAGGDPIAFDMFKVFSWGLRLDR